jgi:integrase
MITGTLREICETYYYPSNPSIRSPKTKAQYAYALANFAAALGHPPTIADLTDDSISVMLAFLAGRRLKPKTINERAGRILALWKWLYLRRRIDTLPQPQALPVPRSTPLAWTHAELDQLLGACAYQRGMVGDLPASWWWASLHYVLWDSGERIGALIQSRWEWVSDGWLIIPAEVRKSQTEDRTYRLSPESVAWLDTIRRPRRDLVWPWPYAASYLWIAYRKLRKRAGLPTDRRSSFHRMRRSVASHFEAAGGNATELLGHSDRRLTKRSYLDVRIVKAPQASDLLFRLNRDPPAPNPNG